MRLLQIIPAQDAKLYASLIGKIRELTRNKRGTLHIDKQGRGKAKISHVKYEGWINAAKGQREAVDMEVRAKDAAEEWKLVRSILGFLDRHFADEISSISIYFY